VSVEGLHCSWVSAWSQWNVKWMVGDMLLQQTLRLAASGHHPRSVARRILHHRVGSVFDFHLIAYVSGSLLSATASV
jgi:hypothetical protein